MPALRATAANAPVMRFPQQLILYSIPQLPSVSGMLPLSSFESRYRRERDLHLPGVDSMRGESR
jgi:hypothetical protein